MMIPKRRLLTLIFACLCKKLKRNSEKFQLLIKSFLVVWNKILSKLRMFDQNCVNRPESAHGTFAFPVFISPIVWNMCEIFNMNRASVDFKELHNDQESLLLTDNIQNGASCNELLLVNAWTEDWTLWNQICHFLDFFGKFCLIHFPKAGRFARFRTKLASGKKHRWALAVVFNATFMKTVTISRAAIVQCTVGPRSMNTRLIRTPVYNGQFPAEFLLSRRKADIFSLKLTRLIRTPVKTDNGHLFMSRVTFSLTSSTSLYQHWLSAHSV